MNSPDQDPATLAARVFYHAHSAIALAADDEVKRDLAASILATLVGLRRGSKHVPLSPELNQSVYDYAAAVYDRQSSKQADNVLHLCHLLGHLHVSNWGDYGDVSDLKKKIDKVEDENNPEAHFIYMGAQVALADMHFRLVEAEKRTTRGIESALEICNLELAKMRAEITAIRKERDRMASQLQKIAHLVSAEE